MGLLDFLKSDEDKFKEKQTEFQEVQTVVADVDSMYNDLKKQSPWLITPELDQAMQALRTEADSTNKYLQEQQAALAKTGGGPGIIQQITGTAGQVAKKGLIEPGSEFLSGVYSASANFTNMLDNWTKYLSEQTGLSRGGLFEYMTKEFQGLADEFSKQGVDPEDAIGQFQKYLYSGTGQAAFDLPVIMAMGLPAFSATAGGAEAIDINQQIGQAKQILAEPDKYDEETILAATEIAQQDPKSIFWGTVAGGIHGLLLHGILKGVNYLPLPERALAGAGVFGVPAAVDEMKKSPDQRDYPRIVSELLIGAGLVLPGGKAKTRRQLLEDIKTTYGQDFNRLVERYKNLAEDRQLNAYAKQRAEVIARLSQTPEGLEFVKFMRPTETFEEARWRYMHQKINERGAEYEKKIAAEKGRKIAEEEAQAEARAFQRRILGKRINERAARKESEQRMAMEQEQEIKDREKRAQYEKQYLNQLGIENQRMSRLDDMNIELMQKEAAFMQEMETIMQRYADVQKKPSEGAPTVIPFGGTPEQRSPLLFGEKPSKEIIEEQRHKERAGPELPTVIEKVLAETDRLRKEGKYAETVRGDQEVAPETPSGVQRGRGEKPRSEDLQREQEAERAAGPSRDALKTEKVQEAITVMEESRGKLGDESLTGRGYQLGVKARTDKELADKIDRGLEEMDAYIAELKKAGKSEEQIQEVYNTGIARQYYAEAKQALEQTGGFKHAVEKGEVDVETGKFIPEAERKGQDFSAEEGIVPEKFAQAKKEQAEITEKGMKLGNYAEGDILESEATGKQFKYVSKKGDYVTLESLETGKKTEMKRTADTLFKLVKEGPREVQHQKKRQVAKEQRQEKAKAEGSKVAEKMRATADKMQNQIDAKLSPAIAEQRPTARRARIADSMAAEGKNLQKVQSVLRSLADMHEKGQIPEDLASIRTKAEVQQILQTKKFPQVRIWKYHTRDFEEAKGSKSKINRMLELIKAIDPEETSGVVSGADLNTLRVLVKSNPDKLNNYRSVLAEYDRMNKIGIKDSYEYSSVRQELLDLAEKGVPKEAVKEQEIKKLERDLLGTKIPGYFPTPKTLVKRMVHEAKITEKDYVVDPSAGKGNILDEVAAVYPLIKRGAIEINPTLQNILKVKGHKLTDTDFLETTAGADRFIMNPPFEKGQDIQHVQHAYSLLNPGGRIVAIMSEGPFFRNDKQSTAFREWFDEVGALSEKIPSGSFKTTEAERQTGVAARLVVIDKPAEVKDYTVDSIKKIKDISELREVNNTIQDRTDPQAFELKNAVYQTMKNVVEERFRTPGLDKEFVNLGKEEWEGAIADAANSALNYGAKAASDALYARLKESKNYRRQVEEKKIESEQVSESEAEKLKAEQNRYEDMPVRAGAGKRYVKDTIAKKAPDPEDVHATVRLKTSALPILEKKSWVIGDKMYTTDLETWVITKTDKAEGFYKKTGKELLQDKSVKWNKDELPRHPKLGETKDAKIHKDLEFEIPYNDLSRAIKATSNDGLRVELQRVNMKFRPTHLEIVATDRHRLTVTTILKEDIANYPDITGDFININMSQAAARALLKDRYNTKVKLSFDDKMAKYEQGDKQIWDRISQEPYPDYERVIPEEYTKGIKIPVEETLDALTALKPILKETVSGHVDLFRTKDGLTIRVGKADPNEPITYKKVEVKNVEDIPATTKPEGEFTLLMPIRYVETMYAPKEHFISYNGQYLLDLLGGVKDKEAIILKNKDDGPTIITGTSNPTLYLEPVKKGTLKSGGSGPAARTTKYDMLLNSKLRSDFQNSDLDNPIRVRDIGKRLAEEINYEVGKDVRMGFIKKFRRRAMGLFFPDSGIIRINNINDLGTFSHEIGHLLDKHIFGFEQRMKADRAFQQITMAFGIKDAEKRTTRLNRFREKYGSDVVDSLQERYEMRQEMKSLLHALQYPNKKMEEAIAEFVHHYVTFPELVRKTTPKFYELFEAVLDEQPQFKKALLRARDKFKEYREQDPRSIVESTIHRYSEENRLLQGIKKTKDGFFNNVIDGTQPFHQLSKELRKKNPNISGDKDPLLQVLSLLGIEGKATQYFHYHPFLRRGSEISIQKHVRPLFGTRKNPGIIYEIIDKNMVNEFEGYLIAKRNLELIERGMPDAATTDAKVSRSAIEGYERQFGADYLEGMRQQLWEYQKTALQYYFESGKMSKENFMKALELNEYYVPFKRFFDVYEGGSSSKYKLSQYIKDYSPTPVKKIRGSDREVVSPLGSIIKNTYDLLASADRNTALSTIVEALHAVDKRLVQEIPAKQFRPVRVLPEDKPFVDEEGNTWMSLNTSGGLERRIAVEYKKPRNAEVITVTRDGIPHYYQIPKRYYDSFFALQEPLSKAIRLLAKPATLLRAGAVVYDPTFAVRNVTRDQVSAWFYTRYGYAPWDFLKGVMSAAKKTEQYQKFLASGADQSFLTAIDKEMSRGYIEKRAGKKIQTKWQEYKRNPLLLAQDMNRASELGTRVGAFQKAYKKTGDVYTAMQEGREIAGDYGVKGQAMRSIAPLYPFLNARIQHAKLIPQSLIRRRPAKFIARALPLVAGSLLNWYWNHRDDRAKKLYNELPTWRKIGMWNIHIPGTDSFLPLPRGPLGILFGATTEKFLDHLEKEDPVTLEELGSEFAEDYLPIYVGPDLPRLATEVSPQVFRPIVEQAMNKIGYTGRAIIPERYRKLNPEDQYDIYTNEIIKNIGQATGLSPMRIQHFITAYTAGAGRGALSITDEILESAGITEKTPDDLFTRLSRLPLTRAFVTEATLGTRGKSVQKFYEKLDHMESLSATVNQYVKDDNLDRVQQILQGKDAEDYKWYLDNKRTIGRFREVLRVGKFLKTEIAQAKTIEDRRGMIRTIDEALTNLAIEFNHAYAEGKAYKISDIMNAIYSFGVQTRREQQGLRRQFSGEIKSAAELKSAMDRLNLYKLREKAGTLKSIDYYRMKSLENKLKRFNQQQTRR